MNAEVWSVYYIRNQAVMNNFIHAVFTLPKEC